MLRWIVLLGVLELFPGVVSGQAKAGPGGGVVGPLDKAQLVRLLAQRTVSRTAIARMVRRSCLTFRPTARDSVDFQLAGADRVVFAALAGCARRTATPGAGRAERAGRPVGSAGAGALRVLAAPGVTAEVGTVATITVRLLGGGSAPQPGMVLVLAGSAGIPGGLVRDARAITDARGAATFRVPVGTAVGSYSLAVTRPDGGAPLPGGSIGIVTQPGRALHATVVPAVVEVRRGQHQRGSLTLIVMDVYGNPVPAEALELRPVSAQLTGPLTVPATDAQGRVAFSLPFAAVRREGEIAVFARGGAIGSFMLRLAPVVLSQYLTRFTAGTSQRGAVGSLLAQPLEFQVRDTSGAAIADQTVTFTAMGGVVEPAAAASDSTGVARVRVALGERAGPVVVTATAGTITQRATLYAEPGAASALVVLRDTAQVGGSRGSLVLPARGPVVLRVVARDQYGNATALTGFAADVTGPAVRVQQVVAGDSQGVVTLQPRRRGAGLVHIRGSGLATQLTVETMSSAVGAHGWTAGVVSTFVAFDYSWYALPNVKGRPGAATTVFGGRNVSGGLSLLVGGQFGVLKADTTGGTVTPLLTEGYARAEYSVRPEATASPVLFLGGGRYLLRGGDNGRDVYHANWFWTGGVGVDVVVSPKITATLRVERQSFSDTNQGRVATLWPVGGGVRVGL